MSNKTLELSEHELYFLPPGTPATAPATRVEIEIDGALRVFLVRSVWGPKREEGRRHFHMLCKMEDGEDNGVLCKRQSVGEREAALPKSELEETLIRRHLNSKFLRFSLRYWHPVNAEFGVAFYFAGSGGADVKWMDNGELNEEVCFLWADWDDWNRKHFLSWPQSDFLDFCQQLYHDQGSLLRHALKWKEFTVSERDAVAFGCERGDWKTLQTIFGLVQKVVTHQHGIFPFPSNNYSCWQFDRSWSNVTGKVEPCEKAIEWSNRWRAAICEIMRPSFWRNEPLCVYRWRQLGPSKGHHCSVRCGIPTHHEVLEAQLELRDFLRPHLPADEIEKLLHPQINQL